MLAGIVQYANFVVYGSMAAIWGIVALPNLIALYSIGREFKDESGKLLTDEVYLQQVESYLSGDADDSFLVNSSFNRVKCNFIKYADEVRDVAQNKDVVQFVDINDYFNITYIDEIARTNLCDLIPGAMTGLGILGTFMGLVAGITGFSADSSENISIGINNLLGGMNTAFMTSIVGVVASLLFSFIHKPLYNFCVREMENYVSSFHRADLDKSSKKLENQLLIHGKNQTNMLQSFSNVIAMAISDTMKAELVPVFKEMRETTEEFVNFSSAQQKNSLKKIVNEFVTKVNGLLNNQLEEISQKLKDVSLQMQSVVDGICQTSGEVDNINKISRQTVAEVKNFVNDLSSLIERQNEIRALIGQDIEAAREQVSKNAQINEEQAKRLQEVAAKINEEASAAESSISLMRQYCQEKVTEVTDAAYKRIEQVNEAAQHSLKATENVIENNKQLTSDLVDSVRDNMNTLVQCSANNNQQMIKVFQDFSEQIKIVVSQAQASTQNSIDKTDDVVRETHEQINSLIDAMEEHIKSFYQQQMNN